jgi:hypothetical protein
VPNYSTVGKQNRLRVATLRGRQSIRSPSASDSFGRNDGAFALHLNTSAGFNTAIGAGALREKTTGDENTAVGTGALGSNITGIDNVASGDSALPRNVDGNNTAVGHLTGANVISGFNNTYIGDFVGFTTADESDTIRIGDVSNGNGAGSLECYIGGISNNFQPVSGTVVAVTLDLMDDHLGWDSGADQSASASVRRGAPLHRIAFGAPTQRPVMLNGKVEKLEATVAQQQKQIENLTAQLREQAAQIQKVSAKSEASNPAPQVVNNR